MNNNFDSVPDSSIWVHPSTLSAINGQDNRLCIGVIREVRNAKDTNELRYMVEVYHRSDTMIVPCQMLRNYGGVYNYEDVILRGYTYNGSSNNQNGVMAMAGDVVLVGKIGGSGREGVILGGLTHPSRKSFLDAKKGPQYKSEFNGIETSINEDGEWTLTFKGQPTNLDKLKNTPSDAVAAPEYDKDVGTSYMKWDKTGSFTLSDEATDDDKIQRFFVDKKNGTIDIDSGKINLKFTKKEQSVALKCKINETTAETSITDKTKKYAIEATDSMLITTPKFVVKGEKIRLGEEGASDWLILGTTYRKEDKKMNDEVATQLQKASIALMAAGAGLTTAGGIPCVPGVPLAALAAPTALKVIEAATALLSAYLAVMGFELAGASNNYLSAVSKTK